MQAACNFAAAAARYEQLIALGHGASHGELAWIMIDGREGITRDAAAGFSIAQRGSRIGCMHSRGVLSYCHVYSYGCPTDLELGYRLAVDSAAAGSKYGQLMLGAMLLDGKGGAVRDVGRALALYRSAAAQGLDAAQFRLGRLNQTGQHIKRDAAEALRWFLMAARQGHPWSCHEVADQHLEGVGTLPDKEEAVRWYVKALAGGCEDSEFVLRRLGRLSRHGSCNDGYDDDYYDDSDDYDVSAASALAADDNDDVSDGVDGDDAPDRDRIDCGRRAAKIRDAGQEDVAHGRA